MAPARHGRKQSLSGKASAAAAAGRHVREVSPACKSVRSLVTFLAAAVAGALADLLTKHYVFAALTPREGRMTTILTGLLRFRLSWNEGIVFGIRLPGPLVLITTLAAVAIVIVLFATSSRRLWGLHLGLGMVLGGAVGNAWDRVRFGAVRDFIDVHLPVIHYDYPTFNVADALLVIGVGVIMVHLLRHPRQEPA